MLHQGNLLAWCSTSADRVAASCHRNWIRSRAPTLTPSASAAAASCNVLAVGCCASSGVGSAIGDLSDGAVGWLGAPVCVVLGAAGRRQPRRRWRPGARREREVGPGSEGAGQLFCSSHFTRRRCRGPRGPDGVAHLCGGLLVKEPQKVTVRVAPEAAPVIGPVAPGPSWPAGGRPLMKSHRRPSASRGPGASVRKCSCRNDLTSGRCSECRLSDRERSQGSVGSPCRDGDHCYPGTLPGRCSCLAARTPTVRFQRSSHPDPIGLARVPRTDRAR